MDRPAHRVLQAGIRRCRDDLPDLGVRVDAPEFVVDALFRQLGEPGAVERALCEDLEQLTGEPPWKRTLSRIAMLNARLLDQAPGVDRLDLISPIQLRTLEVLNRLRAVSSGSSIADDAAALLRDMADEETSDAGTGS